MRFLSTSASSPPPPTASLEEPAARSARSIPSEEAKGALRTLAVELHRSAGDPLTVVTLPEDRGVFFEYDPTFLGGGIELPPFKLRTKPGLIAHTDHAFGVRRGRCGPLAAAAGKPPEKQRAASVAPHDPPPNPPAPPMLAEEPLADLF
jgi:hypothetical protein